MATKPSGRATSGGLSLPGWRVLIAFWVVVSIGVGTAAMWAERNAALAPPPAEAAAADPARLREATVLAAASPAELTPPQSSDAAPDPDAELLAPAESGTAASLPAVDASPVAGLRPEQLPPVATDPPIASAAPGPRTLPPAGADPDPPAAPTRLALVVPPMQAPPPVLAPPPAASVLTPPALAAPPAASVLSPPVLAPPPPPPRTLATPTLPPGFDTALFEPSRHGLLPRRAADGRLPYQVYAQPFTRRNDNRPRVGLIIADSGAYGAYTEDALRRLPPQVAIAVSPYAPHAETIAARARDRGMETLAALPMEPAGYPLNDPGLRALLTIRSPAENADNLDWVLSRFPGYVGVVGALGPMRGERFANLPDHMRRVHDALRERGLLYIDARPGTPTSDRVWGRTVDIVVDDPPTRNEIERRLSELDTIARLRGSAVGYAGTLSPTLLDRLATWWAGLEARGLILAPVSSMLRVRQPLESTEPTPVSVQQPREPQ